MSKTEIFINDDKRLDLIIKTLKINITKDEHDHLVYELYRHIEHTRRNSFRNGYNQGAFDEKMSWFNQRH